MSDIILPDAFVDFELYALPTSNNTVEDKDLSTFILSGGNQKQTLIVYSYEKGQNKLSEEHLIFLQKIFAAIKYDIEKDVALLGITDGEEFSFEELKKSSTFKYVVSFGPKSLEMGLQRSVELYTPTSTAGAIMIFAHNLSAVAMDKTKKISLWKCLQATFLK